MKGGKNRNGTWNEEEKNKNGTWNEGHLEKSDKK